MCSETTGTNTDRIDMLFAVVQARLDAVLAQGRSISIGLDLMIVQIDKVIRDVAILREQQAELEPKPYFKFKFIRPSTIVSSFRSR